MANALAQLRIVEIGQGVAAPYAAKLLADLGADVIKIEQKGVGDPLRSEGSFPDDPADPAIGALFVYLNANKRSVEIDLAGGDVDSVLRIVAEADIMIEDLGMGGLEDIGLDMDTLKRINPRLALVRLSNFGQDGIYAAVPATDFTVQAASVWVTPHQGVGRDPVQVGGRITEYVFGVHAACAALTSYRTACQLGEAVTVDISKQECLLSVLPQPALHHESMQEMGTGIPENHVYPVPGVVSCKDGFVGMNCLTAQHFADVCNLMEVPQYIEQFPNLNVKGPLLDGFYKDIEPWLMARGVDEIVELCQLLRIPVSPVSDAHKLLELAQLRHRSFYIRNLEDTFTQPAFPYRLEATPASLRTPAPALGEHTAEIIEEPWQQPAQSKFTPRASHNGRENVMPFNGVRVLDLGTFWAGPYISCYLGAMGADVIKVESIQRPDGFRYNLAYPQQGSDWYERSGVWQGTNLNKRDITLDLNSSEGKALFERLVQQSDVLIENYSARVMDNFGLSVERLRELNPKLIEVRLPGFGLEGPWRDYVGWAMAIEQASGIAWMTGEPDDPPLNPGGFADPTIAMHALVALQAALQHRNITGEAQMIEVAQLETAACITAEQVIAYSMSGRILTRIGNRSNRLAPQGLYRCTEGDWVAISVRSDGEWQNLVAVMGVQASANGGRYATTGERMAHHDDIDRMIKDWTKAQPADAIVAALRSRGIPVAKLLLTGRLYEEPHLADREFYQYVDHPIVKNRRYARWPMHQVPGPARSQRFGAPMLGQHNYEVLNQLLGLSSVQIDDLAQKGVVGTVPRGLG